MKLVHYLTLLVLGIAVVSCIAFFQPSPGYMDADYYFSGGLQLAGGRGFTEPYLWNYLDNPSGIPHPSHAYWMPLAAMLAGLGMALTGSHSFPAARLGFILFAGCSPPLTAALAYQINHSKPGAIIAGLLAAFSGFYLVFLPTTDTFSVVMVLGGLFFLVIGKITAGAGSSLTRRNTGFFILGILAGFLHLSRADGLVWLVAALAAVNLSFRAEKDRAGSSWDHGEYLHGQVDPSWRKTADMLPEVLIVLFGYFIIMGPWMARNFYVFGTALSPGAGRTLWLTNYDELFIYPAGILTPERWLASGIGAILKARAWALGQNLQTIFAVQGEIFLAPLILAGVWQNRSDSRVRLGLFSWILVVVLMTILFPFAGARGGLFHAGAAFQPLFWALVPTGLGAFVKMGKRLRGWEAPAANKTFGAGVIVLAMLLSFLTVQSHLTGTGDESPAWGQEQNTYRNLETVIQSIGARPEDVVMVNNPPGYYTATDREAIFTPAGGVTAVLTVAERYHARYLLLEINHPKELDELYDDPGDRPGMEYLFQIENTQVYAIQ